MKNISTTGNFGVIQPAQAGGLEALAQNDLMQRSNLAQPIAGPPGGRREPQRLGDHHGDSGILNLPGHRGRIFGMYGKGFFEKERLSFGRAGSDDLRVQRGGNYRNYGIYRPVRSQPPDIRVIVGVQTGSSRSSLTVVASRNGDDP